MRPGVHLLHPHNTLYYNVIVKNARCSLMGSNSKPSRNSIESFHNPAFQITQRKKSAVTSDLGAIRAKV